MKAFPYKKTLFMEEMGNGKVWFYRYGEHGVSYHERAVEVIGAGGDSFFLRA